MKYELKGNVLEISPEESILSTIIEDMAKLFKDAVDTHHADTRQIILNLDSVETIDSQGLNLLIGLYQECKNRKWGFQVVECTDNVKWLFSIFKLTEVFGVAGESTPA